MSQSRIAARLEADHAAGRGSLLPYLTAGFPTIDVTSDLIRAADSAGAAVVEIGFPYSDSIADGPVIQSSFNHVLRSGHTLEQTFAMISDVRPAVVCGLVAMVSYSLVHRLGLAAFMGRTADSGFDGVILPDVPIEEAPPVRAAAERAGLSHVGLIAPTTSAERRDAIARHASGFVYLIAATGTTGERQTAPPLVPAEVEGLRCASGLPVCVGFGIRSADQVRSVCHVADGAIVGSAVVRRIGEGIENGQSHEALVEGITGFLQGLVRGTAP